MKQIIFLTLLIAAGTAAFAQERDFPPQPPHYEYTGETFSIDTAFQWPEHCNFTASDYIILNPGFNCTVDRMEHLAQNQMWVHHCTTDFKIDEDAVYPPFHGLYGGPNPDDKGCVGAIGGNLDVSSLGGAVYSIPIEVPAGINGMQPNLAITYNSQGGNGLLGWCWDLSGLSSITRTGKTLYHDNVMGGVTLDDENDRFLLDGQRLIEVADYGTQIEYRTEQDGMARIMAYMNESDPSVIDRFIIWQSDGTILEYGCTGDSRIEPQNESAHALCWLLNKVSDRDGNSIIYNYDELQSSGEFYLKSIDYTWNDLYNTNSNYKPNFTVLLYYQTKEHYFYQQQYYRRDAEFKYVHGNLVQQKRLLTDICIIKNNIANDTISNYSFAYFDFNDIDGPNYRYNMVYHRLKSIMLKKGEQTLSPTNIIWEYDTDDHQEYQEYAFTKNDIDSDGFNKFIFVGDFNADGLSDVITVPYKPEGGYQNSVDMKVYLNTGNSEFVYSELLSFTNENGHPLRADLEWIHVADFNGDGYDDIAIQYESDALSEIIVYCNMLGERFYIGVRPLQYESKIYATIGDFLGNNKQSIAVFSYTDGSDDQLTSENLVYWNQLGHSVIAEHFENFEVVDVVSGDFDGDGHAELFLPGRNNMLVCDVELINEEEFVLESKQFPIDLCFSYSLNLFPGDFNGDGLCDLLCYGQRNGEQAHKWYFAFSTGCGFSLCYTNMFGYIGFAPRDILFSHSLQRVDCNSNFSLNIADFDGDGISDVSVCKNADNQIFVYSKISDLNNNNGYGPNGRAVHNYAYCRGQYLHVGNFYGKDNSSFLCYEADQKDDVEVRPILLSMYSINEYNSVARITDGLGNRTEMEYQYIVSTDCHQELLDNDVFIKPLNARTLSSVTSYNVSGKPMTSLYSYQSPLFHKNGHGYLGFAETGVLNKENGEDVSRTTSEFETETMGTNAFALPSHTKTEVYIDNEWKDSYEKTSTYRNVTSTRDDLIVCPALMNTKEYYYNIDKAGTEDPEFLHVDYTEYEYSFGDGDTYYNSYSCTETKQGVDANDVADADACEFRTVETDLYYTDVYDNDWIINKLHNKVLVQYRTGKPNVEHCWWYEYYTENPYQLKLEYDIPYHENNADPLIVQTNYEYYPDGNLKKETIKAPHAQQGEPVRTIEYEYGPGEGNDNEHRLVSKETVSSGNLSYETSYLYDIYDNISKKTASNGLETEYETDPLLVTSKEKLPEGVENVSALRWAHDAYQGIEEYAPDNAAYYCWTKSSGGLPTRIYYDKTGAELRKVVLNLNKQPVITDRQYDERGRLMSVSNPHFPEEEFFTTDFQYDEQDRLVSVTTPDGTITDIDYNGPLTKTTITSSDGQIQESEVTVNAMNWAVKSEDASNSFVEYDHFADGLLASAVVNGDAATTVSVSYDSARNRHTLTDPNYGTLETTYNAYGELKKRISPKEAQDSKETTYAYDGLCRLISKSDGMENTITNYKYNNNPGCRKGTVERIEFMTQQGQNIQTITCEYDDYARPTVTNESRQNGMEYENSLEYDEYSRLKRRTFPSGVAVNYGYQNGYLNDISNDEGASLWHTDNINAFGQLLQSTMGDKIVTRKSYTDQMSYLDSVVTSNNLQNLSYEYDKFGNLHARKDNKRNLEETFTYDEQNRLTGIIMNGMTASMTYDAFGRMSGKQAIVKKNGTPQVATVFSNPVFDNTKVHALTEAEMPDYLVSPNTQDITYSSFDKVKTIDEGDSHLVYQYGYDQQRISMTETVGSTTRKKQYAGNCEFVNEDGVEKSWTFLSGPYGVFAVVEKKDAEENLHYILKDHLGSWTTITDAEGIVEQELSYDAWGNLRDPETWYNHTQADPVEAPMFDRGYTGHEHMTAFGLINMNGRCYDPMMSSFLSVDACLQDPTSAQGFNRYAYCAYNPLRYTDPTGWYMRYGSEEDPPGTPQAPPGYTQTTEEDNVINYDKDDPLNEITVYSNGTWSFPSVPSTHGQGTAYSDPSYYYPTISHSNGNGGHGTGGNIGGGNSHSNNMMNVNNKRAETITHSKSSSIATAALPVTLTCVAVDGPAPYGDVVGAVVGISMLAASGIVWIVEELLDLYENSNGKNVNESIYSSSIDSLCDYDEYSEHSSNQSKSHWNKHSARRSGGDPENGRYGKNKNDNKGKKNKKFIPKVNPNKKH